MTVLRIVYNIATGQVKESENFMETCWVLILLWIRGGSRHLHLIQCRSPQVSIASQGGSDTIVPDISIEVDNIDEVYEKAVV